MQFLTLIPIETKIAILVLFIITLAVLFLRHSLYKKLEEVNKRIARLLAASDTEGIQPPIIDRLKKRYKQASQKLEHVNTIALIDSVYKDEIISYGNFKLQYDRADAITKVLPSLLIAFGLVGTFVGISKNLTGISGIVTSFDKSNPDLEVLFQGLQQPLQDMGVAFSTSLFGLLLGSALTIANTFWNTTIAKYQLLAGLEDYLDNIYKPTVEGNTRLDKAIERMVEQQQEFLLRFHENVGRVLEASFGKAAMQIADECSKINQIAEGVYTNFANAAGTISTGATTFEYAANSLKSQNQTLSDSLREFKGGVETFKIAATQLEQNNIIQNIDRVLGELNTSQQAFTQSTKTLEGSLVGITSSNQTAAELAEKVYQSLHTSITCMDNASVTIDRGANTFSQAAISLEAQMQTIHQLLPKFQSGIDSFVVGADKVENNNIVQNLDRVLISLNTHEQAFTKSAQSFGSSIESMIGSNQRAAQLAQQVYKGWQTSTAQMDAAALTIGAASVTIGTSAMTFEQAATNIEGQTHTLVRLMPQLQTGVDGFVMAANGIKQDNIIKHLDTVVASLSSTQQAFTGSTQTLSAKLEPAITSIDRSINGLQQFGKEVVILSQNTLQVSESTKATVADIDRNYQKVLNSTELSVQNLGEINRSSWQELRAILNHRIEADSQHSDRSIEALKQYITQMSLNERESLSKLLTMIGKLESKLSLADTYPEKSSSFFKNKRN